MNKHIFITISILFLIFAITIPAYSGVLDGKEYIGKNGIIDQTESEDDEIQFKNGKFFSVSCGKYGFGDSEYSTKIDGDKVFFTADIYSEKYGRITYTGIVKGNNLDATFIWFDKGKYGKPEQVKWWKGRLKQ